MKSTFKMFKQTDKKNMLLSLVALILVVCMLTSITYSWIDSISTISVSNQKDVLTIDSATESVVEVEAGGAEIDLGSYFNKSGNMHLTSCSSDGKDFYFKNMGSNSGYRLGTANDVNVNYISCTFQIKSLEDTVYYFKDTPKLTLEDGSTTEDISSYLKCAITVDDETLVLTAGSKDESYVHINDISGSATNVEAKTASFYKWEKTTADKDDYLFFINAGQTKTVNIKLWLQDYTGTNIAGNKKLSTSMTLLAATNNQVVYFKDSSFNASGANKVTNGFSSSNGDSLKMYLASDVTENWEFTKVDGEENVFKAEIPLSYRMQEVYIVRSDNSNTGKLQPENGDAINCDYYWKTKLQSAVGEAVTYSVLGNSIYNLASGTIDASDTAIWSDTEVIYADDQYGLDLTKVTMNLVNNDTDSTDTMYYNTAKGYWVGYVVKDSTKLQFTAKNGSTVVGNWGNHADSKTQVRTATNKVLNSMYIIYDLDKVDTITNIGSWNTYDYWSSNISPYILEGSFNDWTGTPMLYNDKANNVSYASVELAKGTYTFKIYSTNSTNWYGNATSLSFGNSTTTSRNATLNSEGGDVTLNVNADGTLLFTFDSDTRRVDISFTPSVADSGEVRSYVMVSTSLGADWLKEINHWSADTPHRTPTKVGDYTVNNNLYTVASGAWSNGSGSWSYYNEESNTGNALYLSPNTNWKSDGARFAAYFFGSGETWVNMTDSDGDGVYKCEIPSGSYTTVIFVRMNGSTTANNWNNAWNQTNDLTLSSRGSTAYTLYYTNWEVKAENMQFVNANRATYYPSSGYNMGNPVNGAIYYLKNSTTAGTIKANIQKAPTVAASSSLSVGTKTTLTASGSTTGAAYKGTNYSYYVKNTDTGTVRIVPAAWTPLYAGSYTATARANDGYITTAESTAKSITVK